MKWTTIAVCIVLCAGSSFGVQAQERHRCTNAPAAKGAAWKPFIHEGKPISGMYYAQAVCPKEYKPVSGGIRYEGVWNEPGMATKWKQVVSTPYDEIPDSQEAVGWRCLVMWMKRGKPERPDPIWCTAVCCRWN
jgi:hypothetical protein